ncbi:MAG: Non-classical phosphatidylinositol transfer protein (PITP) [Watsoniomyces obsoletus]|nr:MAG: Non-classical phosphatidylinositol transfer protein (PITP) [Watsoniomyces obsoletus]
MSSTDPQSSAVKEGINPVPHDGPTTAPPAVDSTMNAPKPSSGPTWPELTAEHPLRKFQERLSNILQETQHSEIYNVHLSASEPIPFTTTLVLQKFLRANANDLEKAAEQLSKTLQWRKEFQPLKAAHEETFDEDKFKGLGYITVIDRKEGDEIKRIGISKQVVTWNIYGAVKDNKKTFGDIEDFIRWRVALMERSIAHLELGSAIVPIPDYGAGSDPYQMVQIHDYLSVKFLRMDPTIRAASQRTIALFQAHYPELLSRKFFVNVPYVMSWIFAVMRLVVASETSRKLTMLSSGESVAYELGDAVPRTYGGQGEDLEKVGETVKLERKTPQGEETGQTAS